MVHDKCNSGIPEYPYAAAGKNQRAPQIKLKCELLKQYDSFNYFYQSILKTVL